MIITDTTDGKYIGKKVDISVNPVEVSEDLTFFYDKKIVHEDQVILANSNYIITLKEE